MEHTYTTKLFIVLLVCAKSDETFRDKGPGRGQAVSFHLGSKLNQRGYSQKPFVGEHPKTERSK